MSPNLSANIRRLRALPSQGGRAPVLLPGLVPYEVKISERQIQDIKNRLGGMSKGIPTIMSRAINRALQTMATSLSRRVGKKIGISSRVIRKSLRIQWSNRRTLAGGLRIMPYGFSYFYYDPVQTEVGVQLKKGPQTLIPHAFIARIRKHQKFPGVYIRVGKERFPVRAFRTPTLQDEFFELGGRSFFVQLAQSTVNKRLIVETELILSGKRRFVQRRSESNVRRKRPGRLTHAQETARRS